jgi:hypothetical protein
MTFSLERLTETLVAGGTLVFSIRPPRPGHDNWAVNFRVAERETAWNCGPTFPTAEEAIVDALEKIEAMLANRKAQHVSFGRTSVPGPSRFASIEMTGREFHRGTGNTVTEAVEDAVAQVEKAHGKKAKADPKPTPTAEDPLADLLG